MVKEREKWKKWNNYFSNKKYNNIMKNNKVMEHTEKQINGSTWRILYTCIYTHIYS